MKTYKLEQVSQKTDVSSKTGKEYTKVGIKIDGEWHNGFGKAGVTDKWQSGMEITGIELYENNGYHNWRFISPDDRITALEKRVEALENRNKPTF